MEGVEIISVLGMYMGGRHFFAKNEGEKEEKKEEKG
jgi:hypothetical protein